ncbi:Hemoglobin subunit beta-1 [Dissostichus eleginoides]|uniref:Hemoglobin subunit beta-1 n=1 Tax=Dissostichus eleginoides TaxID=100907 RepID=A0AAD9EXU8_DISEL|nr:Hemoglobin subunit beta-1 [Dissostichus eleginoides]
MVEWTEQERAIITSIYSHVDYDDIGPKALSRCLIVYPWTQRHFSCFGNLYNAEAIMGNATWQRTASRCCTAWTAA